MAGPVIGFFTGALNRYAGISAERRQHGREMELTKERQIPQMRQLELQEEKFDFTKAQTELENEFRENQLKLKEARLDAAEKARVQERNEDIARALKVLGRKEKQAQLDRENRLELAKLSGRARGMTEKEIAGEEPSMGDRVLRAMAGMAFPGKQPQAPQMPIDKALNTIKKAYPKAGDDDRVAMAQLVQQGATLPQAKMFADVERIGGLLLGDRQFGPLLQNAQFETATVPGEDVNMALQQIGMSPIFPPGSQVSGRQIVAGVTQMIDSSKLNQEFINRLGRVLVPLFVPDIDVPAPGEGFRVGILEAPFELGDKTREQQRENLLGQELRNKTGFK